MIHNRPSRSQAATLAAGLAVALAILPSNASAAEAGWVDTAFNAWDILYDYQNQSRGPVIELMNEPKPDNGGAPFTLEYLQELQKRDANLYTRNKNLLADQQKLVQKSRELLAKLPKDHPRYAEIVQKTKAVIANASETRTNVKKFGGELAKDTIAVVRWKKKEDPLYKPSEAEKAVVKLLPKKEEETKPPEPPPQTEDNGLAKLKAAEAALEKEARALGKEREAAVQKYINDPTPENRAAAEAIKTKLIALVNRLNEARHRVDEIEGKKRPDLHVRTAREIASRTARDAAKDASRRAARPPKPSMPEGHHHGPGGY